MKNYNLKILFFSLLFISCLYGQDYETVAKSDTIFVIYKGLQNEKKYVYPLGENGYNGRDYQFLITIEDSIVKNIIFYNLKEVYRDNINTLKKSEKRWVNKRFIKKNKNIIIGTDFLTKYAPCKLKENILNRKKIIYLIDLTEKRKRNANMFEVTPSDICQYGE
jgi:hypothetical protein